MASTTNESGISSLRPVGRSTNIYECLRKKYVEKRSTKDIPEEYGPSRDLSNCIQPMGNPPEITIQPVNQTDCIYNSVVFSAGFTAAGSVSYQWESNDGSGWT
jgi:hypothetical protein